MVSYEVSSVGRALVWRSRGPGFNSRCLPVLGMGSPNVVNGRGVGSRAAPVALWRSRSAPVNGKTWSRVEGERKKSYCKLQMFFRVYFWTRKTVFFNSSFSFHSMTRFVGRSWNAQKKRQIPFDSWWCADSKNVIFIKIGRWPFSEIALWCLTRYLFL